MIKYIKAIFCDTLWVRQIQRVFIWGPRSKKGFRIRKSVRSIAIGYTLSFKTLKFIQTSDDLNMATYLFNRTDDNICLYRGYKFSNASFQEQHMTSIDLNSVCNDVSQADETNEYCYNVLRFSDRENSGEIKEFWDIVTCKCFHSFHFTYNIIYS